MATHYSHPVRRYVVTHSGSDIDLQDCTISCAVTKRVNAIDTFSMMLTDQYSSAYGAQVSSGDAIKIYWDYADAPGGADPPTDLIFSGYIDEAKPSQSAQGTFTSLSGRQVGRSLLNMVCGEEYGTESVHPSLNTVLEILTNSSYGVLPKWVNKVNANLHGSNIDSGYNLAWSSGGDEYIADITGSIRYLYFPYKPVKDLLNNDLLTYIQAVKGSGAGAHWIVTPDNYFCLATVGNHEAGPATKWPTNYGTLEQGVDFTTHDFQKRAIEKNYIIYYSRFRKPLNEVWSEVISGITSGKDLWAVSGAGIAVANDTGNFKVGASSIKCTNTSVGGGLVWCKVPNTDQNWEIDKWGGKHNIPHLSFWVAKDNQITLLNVRLHSGSEYVNWNLYEEMTTLMNTWMQFNLPIGKYWNTATENGVKGWTPSAGWTNSMWDNVDYILFESTIAILGSGTGYFWVDGLALDGWVNRASRYNDNYSATNPCKIKVITDDLSKDDSGIASDTTGTIARVSYADLLVEASSPIQGTITVPLLPDLMAGQLVHIHAAKNIAGVGYIDGNMRVQEVQHVFGVPCVSVISLTSDLVNGVPLPPMNSYNLLLKMVNPDFQSRQYASTKARDVDITQAVMETSY